MTNRYSEMVGKAEMVTEVVAEMVTEVVAESFWRPSWLTGGLHDPRVQFWEPTKFAATLRHANPDGNNLVCLKLDMSAGHFSASDRYKYLKELSIDYAFLLWQMRLADEE